MNIALLIRCRFAITALLVAVLGIPCAAIAQKADYQLGSGDVVKVTVFKNPDLTTETRVSEGGTLTFPLIGEVPVGGLTTFEVEKRIAQKLKEGGFVAQAQVNAIVLQFKSIQVSVLGQVNKPGRYPIEGAGHRLTDVLALAGGVMATGADTVTLVTTRSGKEERIEVDLTQMLTMGDLRRDVTVANGDVIYVARAPMFYIYGEVQRPGQFRMERDMTVLQALATGGGLTLRGTQRGIRIKRRDSGGTTGEIKPLLNDLVRVDDVIYVPESLF